MRISIIYIVTLALFLITYQANAQDVLTANDLNTRSSGYNTAFIANSEAPFNIVLSSALGNGIQGTGKINLLAYGIVEKYGLGLGLKVNSKHYGLFNTNTAEFLYAKELKINKDHKLFAGLSLGMHFTALNLDVLNEGVNWEDPFLIENDFPQQRFTTGLGLGYTMNDALKVGFAMPGLVKTNNKFHPSFIANTSYKHTMPNHLSLTPEVMVYGTESSPLSIEGNLKVEYKDYVWLKLAGRSTKTALIGVGWKHKIVEIGYAYNMSFSDYAELSPRTHNVSLAFQFGEYKDEKLKASRAKAEQKEAEQLALSNRVDKLEAIARAKEKDKEELEGLIREMNNKINEVEEKVAESPKVIIYKPELNEEPTAEIYSYYVVVGASKKQKEAWDFQQTVRTKLNLETNIVESASKSWYFIFSSASNDLETCKKEVKLLQKTLDKGVLNGEPWIYVRGKD